MGWIVIIGGLAAIISIDQWHRSNCRKWDEMTSKPDNSLAGAMERSRRYAACK